MDRAVHRRYLDYREKHAYFGKAAKLPLLGPDAFAEADAELRALTAKGQGRTKDDEVRHEELVKLLLLD